MRGKPPLSPLASDSKAGSLLHVAVLHTPGWQRVPKDSPSPTHKSAGTTGGHHAGLYTGFQDQNLGSSLEVVARL